MTAVFLCGISLLQAQPVRVSETLKELDMENISVVEKRDTITAALTDEGFLSVAQNAANELVADAWRKTLVPAIVHAVLLAAVIVLGVLYYRKLVKTSILGDGAATGRKFFSKPDAEDIFEFKD